MTPIHWMEGQWRGRLGLAARPRGGDWLSQEMTQWRQAGADTVVSFLTPAEELELQLDRERQQADAAGMRFFSLPIEDRSIPHNDAEFWRAMTAFDEKLATGESVVLHCRQGIGRTGVAASCLLILHGMDAGAAVEAVSLARGLQVPDTAEQRLWIARFAESLTPAR